MNKLTTSLLLAILIAFASGCSEPKAQPPDPAAPGASPAALVALDACVNPYSFCYEPTIAQLDDGTIVVSNGLGSSLARLAPNDDAFAPLEAPPIPPEAASGLTQTDVLVVADGSALYYSALLGDYSPPAGQIWLMGLQVARSDDGGTTWTSNVLLNLPEGTDSTFGADRQWVVASGDDVYVSFLQVSPILGSQADLVLFTAFEVASAVRVAASHDGGRSFGSFVDAFPRDPEPTSGIGGPPVILADGRIAVPAFRYRPISPASLEIAISDDEGQTFHTSVVFSGDPAGDFFPRLAESRDGLAIAWRQNGRIVTAESSDGGQSWTTPTSRMDSDASTQSSPWLAALPNGDWALLLAVADPGNDSASMLQFQVGHPGEPTWPPSDFAAHIGHSPGGRPSTDFVHFVLSGNDAWVVWVDANKVWTQRVPLGLS